MTVNVVWSMLIHSRLVKARFGKMDSVVAIVNILAVWADVCTMSVYGGSNYEPCTLTCVCVCVCVCVCGWVGGCVCVCVCVNQKGGDNGSEVGGAEWGSGEG